MNDNQVKNLKLFLAKLINFVDGKTKEYSFTKIESNEKTLVYKLEDLPCEFTLMVYDKSLVNKQKNGLQSEIQEFLNNFSKQWEFFTGDLLHPIPNSKSFNKELYNPTLGYYGMKNNKSLWVKKCGEVRLDYLKSLSETL